MRLRFNWLGYTYFTKPYTSIGGFTSRWIYYFDIVRHKKHHEKKFGRWDFDAQDDVIHFFSFYPLVIMWGNMPDRKFAMDKKKVSNKKPNP